MSGLQAELDSLTARLAAKEEAWGQHKADLEAQVGWNGRLWVGCGDRGMGAEVCCPIQLYSYNIYSHAHQTDHFLNLAALHLPVHACAFLCTFLQMLVCNDLYDPPLFPRPTTCWGCCTSGRGCWRTMRGCGGPWRRSGGAGRRRSARRQRRAAGPPSCSACTSTSW